MERNDKCFCGSGKKYKKCHYRIKEKSKLADMYKANLVFDEACITRGVSNNCISDCSECCKDFFFVTENEFLMILEALLNNGADINLYKEKAKRSLEIIKKVYPDIIERLDRFMPTGGNIMALYDFFKDNENPVGIPTCIFLNSEKKCAVYECRPIICKMYGSTTTCQYIGNMPLVLQEGTDLNKANTIIYSKEGSPLIKRPYPIFYWFSFFLDEPYYSTVLLKLSKFRDVSESEYYDFTLGLK